MAGKRQIENTSDSDEPKSKRMTGVFPRCNIGPVASLEELDMKTLHFQNRKLYAKLESYRQDEADLLEQVESTKAREKARVATLSLINRNWEQLVENLKVDLLRLEKNEEGIAEKLVENEDKKQSFHRLLKNFEFQEIKETVTERSNNSRQICLRVLDAITKEKLQSKGLAEKIADSASVNEGTKMVVAKLQKENDNLNTLMTSLQKKHEEFFIEKSTFEDKIEEHEDIIADLQETVQTSKWELKKARRREEKLANRVTELMTQINNGTMSTDANQPSSTSSTSTSSKNGDKNTEEWQVIAEGRLAELEQLKTQNQEALKEVEKLKLEMKHIPEATILESCEYKTLKSQFSVLYHESVQLKNMLEDARMFNQQTKLAFTRKMEKIECDEYTTQKKLRNELIQSEDNLAKVRHEYETLHAEYEQNMTANEQAGPVNREMRHLINSLQNQNRQLKSEGQRYKKKCKELQASFNKLRDEQHARSCAAENEIKETKSSATTTADVIIKEEPNQIHHNETPNTADAEIKEKEEDQKETFIKDAAQTEIETLKTQLRKEEEKYKEATILLEMLKTVTTEQREKAEIMTSEKANKLRADELHEELTDLKNKLNSLRVTVSEQKDKLKKQEEELKEVTKQLDDEKVKVEKFHKSPRGSEVELARKAKALEETVTDLRRNLAATKQEEEALLSEMDVTGTAFEDMQEQNMRLLQQLREKDDANFKLMSERIKSNQIQKLLQEEKAVLEEHKLSLTAQVESQCLLVRKLEEKERVMHNALITMQKDQNLRFQIVEMNKKKAVEAAQETEDLKREMEKYEQRITTLEETIEKKVENLEEEHFRVSRIQEDSAKLRRKLEKHKKTAGLYTADEVLMEEIKEYKTKLRCPCCNVNNKDAVLTKCYHVFCIKCIQKRYETRQRKCPKCNAGFGGNDFHRIYIE